MKRIIAQQEWMAEKCPFCGKQFGKADILSRRIRKVCKCRSCGRVIDERMIVR